MERDRLRCGPGRNVSDGDGNVVWCPMSGVVQG